MNLVPSHNGPHIYMAPNSISTYGNSSNCRNRSAQLFHRHDRERLSTMSDLFFSVAATTTWPTHAALVAGSADADRDTVIDPYVYLDSAAPRPMAEETLSRETTCKPVDHTQLAHDHVALWLPEKRSKDYSLRSRLRKGDDDGTTLTGAIRNLLKRALNRKSSVRGAVRNLVNGIVSAGILGVPLAFKLMGMFGGLLLLTFVAWLAEFSFRLIVLQSGGNGDPDKDTYTNLMSAAAPRWGGIAIDVAVVVGGFFTHVAYFVIVGQSFPVVLQNMYPDSDSIFVRKETYIVIVAILIWVMLYITDNVAAYEIVSWYSTIHFIVFSIMMIAYLFAYRTNALPPFEIDFFRLDRSFLQANAILSYTYQSQSLLLPLYRTMDDRTPKTITHVIRASIFLSSFMYLSVGASGYATFGRETQGNILNNFPTDALPINIIRASYSFEILTSMPTHVISQIIHMQSLVFDIKQRYPSLIPFQAKTRLGTNHTRIILTTLELAVTAFIAVLIVDNDRSFGYVVTLAGAVASAGIVYVFPGYSYLFNPRTASPKMTFRSLGAVLLIFYGVFSGAGGLWVGIENIIEGR